MKRLIVFLWVTFSIGIVLGLLIAPVFATSITLTGAGGSTPAIPPTGMKSPLIADNGGTGPSTSAVQFMSVNGSLAPWSAAALNRDQPMAKAGSIKNLTVRFPTVLTQGTYTIALAVNGIVPATAPTCQITTSTATCTDTANEAIFAAGDRLSWKCTPSGTPTAQTQVQISAVFTSYGSDGVINVPMTSNPSNTLTNYTTLGNYANPTAWQATELTAEGIIPTPGTLDSIYVQQGVVSGGTSFTYTIYLNGVSQGASACVIGAAALTCNVTALGIAVVAGDLVSIEAIPAGTPSALAVPRISVGWTPTTVGEAIQITAAAALAGSATRYLPYQGSSAGNATETSILTIAPCAFTAKLLRVQLTAAVTGVNTRDHTMRKGTGGGQSNQALTCQLASGTSAGLACNDSTHTVTTATNDLINWASIGSALDPATLTYKFSSVMAGCT